MATVRVRVMATVRSLAWGSVGLEVCNYLTRRRCRHDRGESSTERAREAGLHRREISEASEEVDEAHEERRQQAGRQGQG